MSCRLIPERVNVGRQVEIVVDRLGHVDDTDTARGLTFELHGGIRGVITANGDELGHVET